MGDVRVDYGFCMEQVLGAGRGISEAVMEALGREIVPVHERVVREHDQGVLGFMDLPHQPDSNLERIEAEAARLRELGDTLLVLGIGGSALGARAVDMALGGWWRDVVGRDWRVLVVDNSDPRFFGQLLEGLDLGRCVVNVVSKSGTTAETMAQYMAVRRALEERLGKQEALNRLCFTTDPEKGVLREIARSEGVASLEVPPNVGGRYSVLSAVGLLPLAFAGHDIRALLKGAARMAGRCTGSSLEDNPAYMFAALAVEHMRRGCNILVMMPYSSDLYGLALWFAQLWAESLGKRRGTVEVGQTPVAAIGATDQHSQLQLYMEGPRDKLIVFITLDDYGCDVPIPPIHPHIPAVAYLGGKTMAKLIASEARATAAALAAQGRPSMALRCSRVDPYCVGAVIYLLELATVAAGYMLGVNPLDQPGVELGKQLTYGLMGREGYEDKAAMVARMESGGRFVV